MKKTLRLERLAIIGLGLMGGSLGLTVKEKRLAATVSGFARRIETRKRAIDMGVVDTVSDSLEEAVRDADFVVFCTPVDSIVGLACKCMPFFRDSCVVTDVGSSKRRIVSALDDLFRNRNAFFVGGHPIAGSERQGLCAASPNLYEGAVVALTPTRRTSPVALAKVEGFWKALGARIVKASPRQHDDLVARTSHVPHIVSAMLAAHVGRGRSERVLDFRGAGFLDATRIAEGDPGLWAEIILSNLRSISRELDIFARQLAVVQKILSEGSISSMRHFLEVARRRRHILLGGMRGSRAGKRWN